MLNVVKAANDELLKRKEAKWRPGIEVPRATALTFVITKVGYRAFY